MTTITQKGAMIYVNNRLADIGTIEHIHQEQAGKWMGFTTERAGERYGFQLSAEPTMDRTRLTRWLIPLPAIALSFFSTKEASERASSCHCADQ